MTSELLKFIADAMLGRLARWLRILGHDVVYESSISDNDLIARAIHERRIILTMDRKLTERESAKNSLLINSPSYKEQLKQVITHYNIDYKSGIFTRCLVCNSLLVSIEKEKIKDRVPSYVYSTQDEFDICPQCGRIYWSGTHRVKMLGMLGEIMK
ncbi:MAG TPA: Mut7-C RNAse domain-containing protein [Candidatus Wunengus sp. YC63]|uniref:Mut7-C RNAse domain-containing protein n=1 Tax=unclassified Candidatus Wunengus TaxID=3367695 RepID=UPI002713DD51|nr:Mut7-C RNAse domain-containing protein [Candidatus Brocadiales bacterium]